MLLDELRPVAAPTVSYVATVDRRRPGRIENPSPHLIGMMRGDAAMAHVVMQHEARDDEHAIAFRGIAIAALLSVPVWVGIALFLRIWL
jgi:hypothetical protein